MKYIENKYYDDLKAWPFIEALKIVSRFGGLNNLNIPKDRPIIFE